MIYTVPDAQNKKCCNRMIGTKAQAHFPPVWFPALFSASGAMQAIFMPATSCMRNQFVLY